MDVCFSSGFMGARFINMTVYGRGMKRMRIMHEESERVALRQAYGRQAGRQRIRMHEERKKVQEGLNDFNIISFMGRGIYWGSMTVLNWLSGYFTIILPIQSDVWEQT